MNFGEILKELRVSHGEKQIDIANILGVSDRTVGVWERNESQPSVDIIGALADHFGVSTDYLVGRTSDPFPFNISPAAAAANPKDQRYLLLGRLLKKSTKEEQERFYKMASLMLEKHPNERLFADAADGEDDDTI